MNNMGYCDSINCGYYWKGEDEDFPTCHYEGPDEWCPCNQEEE